MTTPMPPPPPVPPPPTGNRFGNAVKNAWNKPLMAVGSSSAPVNLPRNVPRMLGQRPIIFYSWMIAIILVGYDEWHSLGIIPRPSRFWHTSLLYGLLVMLSIPDAMVPLANALAIGYTFYLVYQYFNNGGQFSSPPPKAATTPTSGTTSGSTSGG